MKFYYLLFTLVVFNTIKGMEKSDDGPHVVFQIAPSTHHQTIEVHHSGDREIIEVIDNRHSLDLEAGARSQDDNQKFSTKLKKLNLGDIDPDLLYGESASQCLMLLHGSKHEKVSYIHSTFKEDLKKAHLDAKSPHKHKQVVEKLIVHTSRHSSRIKHEVITHQPVVLAQAPISQSATMPTQPTAAPAVSHVTFNTTVSHPQLSASTNVSPAAVQQRVPQAMVASSASSSPVSATESSIASSAIPPTPNNSPSHANVIPTAAVSASSSTAPAAGQSTALGIAEEIGEITLEDLSTLGEILAESYSVYNSLKTKGLIGTGSLSGVLGIALTILGILGKSYK